MRPKRKTHAPDGGGLSIVFSPVNNAYLVLWGRGRIENRVVLKIANTKREAEAYVRSLSSPSMNDPGRRKSSNHLKQKLETSPALYALTKKRRLSRAEAVQFVWAHIKRARLQLPSNGQRFRVDAQLAPLFPRKRVASMFDVAKAVSKNLRST